MMKHRGFSVPHSVKKQHFSLEIPQRHKTYCALVEIRGFGVPEAHVRIYIDRHPAVSTRADCRGGWTLRNPYPLADGHHRVKAVQRYRGRLYSVGTCFFICRSLSPAAPTIEQPSDGTVLHGRCLVVSGQAEPGNTITVCLCGRSQKTVADASGAYQLECKEALPSGSYTLTAVQTNACGNTSPETTRCFCVAAATPLQPPTIDMPKNGSIVTEQQPVVSGQADPRHTVIVCLCGYGCHETVADADGIYRVQFEALLSDGACSITAVQRDAEGNCSEEVQSNFTVAVPQPLPPPTVDAPENGTTVAEHRPVICGQAVPGNAVILCLSGYGCLETTAGSDGRFAAQFEEPLTPEDYALTAVQMDAQGNASPQAQIAFSVVTTPPAASEADRDESEA